MGGNDQSMFDVQLLTMDRRSQISQSESKSARSEKHQRAMHCKRDSKADKLAPIHNIVIKNNRPKSSILSSRRDSKAGDNTFGAIRAQSSR